MKTKQLLLGTGIALSSILFSALPSTALANDIIWVNTDEHHDDGVCDENDCTLYEAIVEAQSGPSSEIRFEQPWEIQVDADLTGTTNWFPTITTDISIDAARGMIRMVDGGIDIGRVFEVTDTGSLHLKNAHLSEGGSTGPSSRVSLGGCIKNAGELTIDNTYLTRCVADSRGGAIHSTGNTQLSDVLFSENQVFSSVGEGGALYLGGAADWLQIERSTFAYNFAPRAGAGIIIDATEDPIYAFISESFIGSNIPVDGSTNYTLFGGGIYTRYSVDLTISNSTIAGNHAQNKGGGIRVFATTHNPALRIFNSTIMHNSADFDGGVTSTIANYQIDTEISNTILANNSGGDYAGGAIIGDHNLFSEESALAGSSDFESPLADLSEQEYPIYTVIIPGRMHVGLPDDSLALANADSSICSATDQMGNGRYGICDIGAVELPSPLERGMTWEWIRREPNTEVDVVSCAGCNPYAGETSCREARKVLCFEDLDLPNPGGYSRWTGGQFVLYPYLVPGYALSQPSDYHEICRPYGPNFRMSEWHDGGWKGYSGWGYYSEQHAAIFQEGERFWTSINNQPAECWN